MQLATELQHVYDAMHNLTAAQMELDMAEQELMSSPGVAKPLAGLRGQVTRTARRREAVQQEGSRRLLDTSKDITRTDDAARAAEGEVESIMAPVRQAQADRLAPPRDETQADREARDAAKRKQDNETAERLGDIPGSRITHEAYWDAMDRLYEAPARIAELERKADNMELPETTRNKAKHDAAVIKRSAALASGMLSRDPERMEATRKGLQAQMDVVGVKIEDKAAALREKGISESTYVSRRKELAELRRELNILKELQAGMENLAEVAPIDTKSAHR
jgi:hypothetical protein